MQPLKVDYAVLAGTRTFIVHLPSLTVHISNEGVDKWRGFLGNAAIDAAFPRVIQHDYDGKTIYGQINTLSAMEINGYTVAPSVSCSISSDTAT